MKISIKNKFIITFMSLIFSILIAQLVFNTFFIKNYYTKYKEDAMTDTFYSIKEEFDGTSDTIISVVAPYEDAHNINITVSTEDEIVYVSQNNYENKMFQSPYKRSKNVDKQRYSYEPKIYIEDGSKEGFEGRSHMILFGAFTYMDEEFYVSIMLPTASIESSLSIFTRSSAIISMCVLVMSIIVSMILAYSITKPIEQIENVASKLSHLDFSDKIDETVKIKELASLAISINLMSEQLESAMASLHLANDELKKDVATQKQLEQMRRQFVANVSHEMKTPLALLQIYSENLKNNVENIDKDYYCDTIIEETVYLDKMVKSMLNISSIESGLSKMNMERQSISNLSLTLMAKMTPLLESFHLETEIEQEVYVMADEKYLEQAMKNYIINAIDHGNKEKWIGISLYTQNGQAIFSVKNKGQQLHEQDIPYLWDSFYRSDKARVRTGKNVGLGLHIVKTIMDKHHGICQGENTENGVVFSFKMPLD